MRRVHRGFTLIELLVVIAIIAVLIALLAARRAGSARGRATHPMRQQPQTDGSRAARVSRPTRQLPGHFGPVSGDPTCIGCGYGAMYTFRTLMLPQIEQTPLYNAINFSYLYSSVWNRGHPKNPRQHHRSRHADLHLCLSQ